MQDKFYKNIQISIIEIKKANHFDSPFLRSIKSSFYFIKTILPFNRVFSLSS